MEELVIIKEPCFLRLNRSSFTVLGLELQWVRSLGKTCLREGQVKPSFTLGICLSRIVRVCKYSLRRSNVSSCKRCENATDTEDAEQYKGDLEACKEEDRVRLAELHIADKKRYQ